MVVVILNELLEKVIQQCGEKKEDALETCKCFCKKWLPDPQNFLNNDGVISSFYELNQFLLSEVFSWSQCELFGALNSDITDGNSPILSCLALFLSLAAAMRCEKANGGSEFSDAFSAVVFEDETHRDSFNFLLLNICHCKSTAEFCESFLFKNIISGEYNLGEENAEQSDRQVQQKSSENANRQQAQTSLRSADGLANETIGSLNMSKMDLNKSVSFFADNRKCRSSRADEGEKENSDSPEVAKKISRLLFRLSSGGVSDYERSFVLNNSGDKSFYGDLDSPFSTANATNSSKRGIVTSSVPPLRNPRLSVSSPYSKLAQKMQPWLLVDYFWDRAKCSKKFNLLVSENDDLKDENSSLRKEIENLQQDIKKSKEQLAIQERQIIDLSDENEAARRSYENTEKQLNRELMQVEKLEIEKRDLKKEQEILSLEVDQTNKRLRELETKKAAWEKRERELLSHLKEGSKYLAAQTDTWAEREKALNNKIGELKQAHDFLAGRRSELQTELNSLKDEKLELEADLTFTFNKEVCSLELQLKSCRDELEQLKATNESQCRSLCHEKEAVSQLHSDKAKLEEEVRLLQESVARSNEDFKSAKKSLQEQVDELFELRNSSEQNCAELKTKLKQTQGDLKISEDKHQEMLKKELDEAENKFGQMKTELSSEIERLNIDNGSKSEKIAELELREKLTWTNLSNMELKLNRASEDLEAERKRFSVKFCELDKQKIEKEEIIASLNEQLDCLKRTSEKKIIEKDQLFSMEKQRWEQAGKSHKLEIEKKTEIISQLNEKVVAVTREMNEFKLEKDRQYQSDVTALRSEKNLNEEENAKMGRQIEMLQQEVARIKGDKSLVHKGLVDRLEAQVASLRNTINLQSEQITDKDSQLTIMKNEMVQLEETVRGCERTADQLTSELSESRDKFEREMQVTKENNSKLTEQLNFQINILSEEKDIMQSSLEMENKNLTDNILQLESEKESLLGENESLKKESEDLASRCHQWKHSYDELMLQNTNTEEAYQDMKNQLEVSEERLSNAEREKRELQEQLNETWLQIEDFRRQLAEIDSLKEQVASLEGSLKYADETTNSFKRLYRLEKDKNLKLSEGHTLTTDAQRKHSTNIKQEALEDDEMLRPATAAAAVWGRFVSRLDAAAPPLPPTAVVPPRKTLSASDMHQQHKQSQYSLRSSADSKPPPMPTSSRGPSSSNISLNRAAPLQSMDEPQEQPSLDSSTKSLRNKASASLQFASTVPDESFFSSQEIVKIMEEVHLPQSRIEDLRRRRHPLGSGVSTGSSTYLRNDAVDTRASVSSIDSIPCEPSEKSKRGRGSGVAHTFASSISAPQLPGAAELPPSSRDLRRVPIVGGFTGGSLRSSFSSLYSSATSLATTSGGNNFRCSNNLNCAQSMDSVLTSSSNVIGGVEANGGEINRWSEIERRNSMYPKHLQSSYPTEEITNSASITEQSMPNRDMNGSGTRKRSKSFEKEVVASKDKIQLQVTKAEVTSAANAKRKSNKSTTTPRKSSRLSSSLISLSASKMAKKENIAATNTASGGLAGSVIGSLSMPSPQKLFHKVTRGRRSNLVEPLTTVPESTTVTSSTFSAANQTTAATVAPPSVMMEFPNTPPVAKKSKRRAPSDGSVPNAGRGFSRKNSNN